MSVRPTARDRVSRLRALTPRLGNTVTTVTRRGDGQLAFSRKSTGGFTALELHLLADWAESPAFPQGLHTTRVVGREAVGKKTLPSKPANKPAK